MTKDEFQIELMQYLRPHGKKRILHGALHKMYEPLYDDMIKSGAHFAIEELRTGQVASYIENNDEDLACRITPNDESIKTGIIDMLKSQPWKKRRAE